MSELGNLLELLVSVEAPFQSLHGVYRIWRDAERTQTAQIAYAQRTGGSFGLLDEQLGDRQPTEVESTVRIWRAPGRARTERYLDGELVVCGVRAEHSWRSWSKAHGVRDGRDDAHEVSAVGRELAVLLEPAQVLNALVFEAHEPAVVAARDVVRVHAGIRERQLAGGHVRASDLHGIGLGADRYVLDFDGERGVLLGVCAEQGGWPFQRIEALEIRFDEPIEPDTFSFSAIPGASSESG